MEITEISVAGCHNQQLVMQSPNQIDAIDVVGSSSQEDTPQLRDWRNDPLSGALLNDIPSTRSDYAIATVIQNQEFASTPNNTPEINIGINQNVCSGYHKRLMC